MDDRLEKALNGYVFYVHSLYPLHIDVDEFEHTITITVRKFYKGHVTKEMGKTCKKLGFITEEQRRELILDVIGIFLRKT